MRKTFDSFVPLCLCIFGISIFSNAQKVTTDKHGTASYTGIVSARICDGYAKNFGLTTLIGTIVEKNDEDDALTVTIRTTRGRKSFNLEVPVERRGGDFYRQVWGDLLGLDSKIRVRVYGCGRLSVYYFAKDIYKLPGKN